MKKLFLHIGPHKTGTTLIQKVFFENREQLLNFGIDYPNVDISMGYGQHGLVKNIRKLEHDELGKYLTEYLNNEITFISSENFDRLNLAEIERLGKCLSKMDVQIIYYHRNYADLLPSSWQEKIKNGATISFHEFALQHVMRPFASSIINPALVLDRYAKIFGKENITVVDYDIAVKEGGILAPILEILDVKINLKSDNLINKSMEFESVEIIRVLNMIAKENQHFQSSNIRQAFLKARKSDQIRNDIEQLSGMIRSSMSSMKLSNGFFEISVKSAFRKKYDSCLYNGLSDEGGADREFLVPGDNWIFKKNAFSMCEHIYQQIM